MNNDETATEYFCKAILKLATCAFETRQFTTKKPRV